MKCTHCKAAFESEMADVPTIVAIRYGILFDRPVTTMRACEVTLDGAAVTIVCGLCGTDTHLSIKNAPWAVQYLPSTTPKENI